MHVLQRLRGIRAGGPLPELRRRARATAAACAAAARAIPSVIPARIAQGWFPAGVGRDAVGAAAGMSAARRDPGEIRSVCAALWRLRDAD
jgi:hypothetical protein